MIMMKKKKENDNDSHSEDNLREGISNAVFSFSLAQLWHVMNSMIVRCGAYLLTEGNHSHHHLEV
jgi:hypothetical protein